MIIIGADYHPGFQQIAFVDTDSGEFQEQRLQHRGEAEKFYRDLAAQGMQVRVGMEASGHARWFERLLSELQFELWIGDAAEIRTKRVRKQKTDRQDAQLILRLLLEDRFPQIWEPTASGSAQRRTALQEAVVAGPRTAATGIIPVGSMGKPATARPAGVAGSAEPEHRGVEPGDRAGSGEMSRGAATDDASWSRCVNRAGFCADHREGRALSVWEADCELPRTGAVGGFQRESAPAGTHHETRQLAIAVFAGRGGASHGTQRPGMAQQVFSPGDAAGTQDRQGRHGPQTCGSSVLDVA
jgi:hypothetical protein